MKFAHVYTVVLDEKVNNMCRPRFKKQTREEFEKERAEIIKRTFEEAEDPNNMIPYEELDWYLEQIELRRCKCHIKKVAPK